MNESQNNKNPITPFAVTNYRDIRKIFGIKKKILEFSRNKYAKPRAQVEKEIIYKTPPFLLNHMTKGYQFNPSIFLLPDEKIVFKTNPHWLFLVIPILQIYLFLLIYFFFACPFLGKIDLKGLEDLCYLASLFIFFILALIFYLDWRFNRLWLTNLRLIKERGIIGKRFMAVRLNYIEDITCGYGIRGRIFSFGDLTIESAGTYGIIIFKGIPRPRKIKITIEKQMFYSNLKAKSAR